MKGLRFADAGAVRAVLDGERRVLEVLAVPYGDHTRKDRLGQFFSPRTQVWMNPGDRRPVLYMHGFSPQMRKMAMPPVLGDAEYIREDKDGRWMRVEIDDSELSTRTWEAAKKGEARASTGSVAHLERHDEVTGEVLMWPVVELSVFDGGEKRVPVSDDAVVLPMRAIYQVRGLNLPEAFEADEAEEAEEKDLPVDDEPTGENPVSDEVIEKAPDPVPEPEPVVPKEEPKHRAIFNVRKETVGEPADNAKKESHEWWWHMRHGITKGPAFRVLEESEAAEGLPMVPQDALNAIVSLRNEYALASKAGLTRYQTDKLIFNIPREATAMTALAAIAEEAAYIANEPVFALLPITVVKYGSMVTATEELLEDQSLFIPWFTEACARAWALAENLALYTLLDTAGQSTVGVHSATLTEAEWQTFFWTMTTPWRDDCVLIFNQTTMAALRSLLITTPRAFGAYPDFAGTPIGYPNLDGVPIFLNANWLTLPSATNLGAGASMLNRKAAGIVERRGMTIKVDPYGDSLNGRIRYFPSVRFAPFVSQPTAGHVVYEGHA